MRRLVTNFAALAAAGLVARHVLRRRRRLDLEGRVVLITGGARGLGLEIARLAMSEGARVAICSRSEADLSRAFDELRLRGPHVLPFVADVTDPDDVKALVAAVEGRWGGIDVLVNNAGIIGVGPYEHMAEADFARAMDVHFWAPLRMIDAVLPSMRRMRHGRIVNIASFGGRVAVPHMAPYTASKFALVGLSESLRIELAREGIRVTTVSPGPMRTGSHVHASFKGRHRAEYRWFRLAATLPLVSTSMRGAAKRILAAILDGRPTLDIGLTPVAAALHGLAPGVTTELATLVNRVLPEPGGGGAKAKTGEQCRDRLAPGWAPG